MPKAAEIWRAAEIWSAGHPFSLAIIVLIFTTIFGLIPATFEGYNFGFYEGTMTSEANWTKSFDNKVKSTVDQQISATCGQITQQLNIDCQRTTKALQTRVSDKTQEIAQLQRTVQNLSNRVDISDIFDVLTGSASSILEQLESAHAKGDRDAEEAGRARFSSLLFAIRRANDIYTDWSALFNSRATELAQRYANKENVSTDDIIDYLRGFSSDLDVKRKIIQSQVDEADKIRRNKY